MKSCHLQQCGQTYSVILSEDKSRERNIIWHPLYVESKKKWNKWIYIQNIETHRLRKRKLWLPVGRDSEGLWEGHIHTAIFKVDIQQGPIAHGPLFNMCASPDGRGVWGRKDACVCKAESLHCSPETTTTLLTGYTPTQNKNSKKSWTSLHVNDSRLISFWWL